MSRALKTVESYMAAVKRLDEAERRHQANLDLMDQARTEKRPHDLTSARKLCAASEADLLAAHAEAALTHQRYWRDRAFEIEPRLHEAARLMLRYDRFIRASGGPLHAAKLLMENAQIQASPLEIEDADIPMEPPDCELLDELRGVWR